VLTIKGKEQKITVTPRTDPTWPLTERGLIFDDERQLQKADGFLQAMRLSAERLVIKVETIYENLLGMIVGRISIKGVAGPISIAKYAFDLAGQDTFEFILFIALININLAVVNFLPIPVLDGGHMVFLGYELLRGKPPSERWRFILTIMGLIVVLGLMFLGLLLDFNRWMLEPLKNWLGL
jgi:regulator of sigma E protease